MKNIIEGVNKAALSFLFNQTLEQTYRTIVKEGCQILNATQGSVILKRKRRLTRVYSTLRNIDKAVPKSHSWCEDVIRSPSVHVYNTNELEQEYPVFKKLGYGAIVLIPLSYRKTSIGLLTFYCEQAEQFSDKEYEMLKLFGSLATLAIEKNRSFEDMKSAIELRDLFISMAAHELRTPLATVNGYIQLLQTRLNKSDSIEKKWGEELKWEAGRLTKLVNELLEVSQIRSRRLLYTFTECSLQEIIKKSIQEFHFIYPERIVLQHSNLESSSDHIVGDEMKLMQVFVNLLSNAAKYSKENTTIDVTIWLKKEDFIIEIQDYGKGITQEDLPRIFEGFYKGKEDRAAGMGLGLYISKNIIESHRGNISVRSELGTGTSIRICLPIFSYMQTQDQHGGDTLLDVGQNEAEKETRSTIR